MPTLRQDPTTKDWVILAPERGDRPRTSDTAPRVRPRRAYEPDCPLCPGNESGTPAELLRLPDESGSGWHVRVVPNKFPAVTPEGDVRRRERGPLVREMDGTGHHELVVETKPYFLWHIRIVPRIAPFAGFEIGSGMTITPWMPEDSAARMRAVLAKGIRVGQQ